MGLVVVAAGAALIVAACLGLGLWVASAVMGWIAGVDRPIVGAAHARWYERSVEVASAQHSRRGMRIGRRCSGKGSWARSVFHAAASRMLAYRSPRIDVSA